MASDDYLFVYGTLRQGAGSPWHATLSRSAEYVSPASMQGELYEVDGYPGAIQADQGAGRVVGELYRIRNSENLLVLLDEYEECSANFPQPHEYVRMRVGISLPNSGTVVAWVYLYNRDVAGLERIESGDYLA